MILLMFVVAIVGYTQLKSINDGMTNMYTNRLLPIEQPGTLKASIYQVRIDSYKLIAISSELAASEKSILTQGALIDKTIKLYMASYMDDAETKEAQVEEVTASAQSLMEMAKELQAVVALFKL